MSFKIGQILTQNHYSVVSGGALGIDITAHRGALENMLVPAPVIAVLPTGFDQMRPSANSQTFDHIVKARGAITTEKLWWQECRNFDFVKRNRIISGMSLNTVIIEAHLKSGTMLTANIAADQGRSLFVYDGPLKYGSSRARGNAHLIEQGCESFSNEFELMEKLESSHQNTVMKSSIIPRFSSTSSSPIVNEGL
jgi:DNA processing protein